MPETAGEKGPSPLIVELRNADSVIFPRSWSKPESGNICAVGSVLDVAQTTVWGSVSWKEEHGRGQRSKGRAAVLEAGSPGQAWSKRRA